MPEDHTSIGNRAINIGLMANAALALLKTTVGILGHSQALLADGINSTSDVAYYVVVKVFMFFARQPPDRAHPYGHRQFESIASLAVGSFVITTAIALFWDAINEAYDIFAATGSTDAVSPFALYAALLTIGAKMGLTFYTHRAAGRTGNGAIRALARDHRNDTIAAAGAAIGIILSRHGLAWGDPVAGAIVAIVVLMTGIGIMRESSAELMDAVPGDALELEARAAIGNMPAVRAVEEILAHRFGPYLVMNVTIGVDGNLSVSDGDHIASEIETTLCARLALVKRVHVHYHPVSQARAAAPQA